MIRTLHCIGVMTRPTGAGPVDFLRLFRLGPWNPLLIALFTQARSFSSP